MKKKFLWFSSILITIVPTSIVISCGSKSNNTDKITDNKKNLNKDVERSLEKNGKIINQGTKTASIIAKSVTNLNDLKNKLGIDLTNFDSSEISISATGNSDGIINIQVKTINKKSPEKNKIFEEKVQGKSDEEILVELANLRQKNNLNIIENALKKATLNPDKASLNAEELANSIKNRKDLKTYFGAQLPYLFGTNFEISATGDDGAVYIWVKTTTKNATIPIKTLSTVINVSPNQEIFHDMTENKKHFDQIAMELQKTLDSVNEINQGNQTTKEFISSIKTIGDLEEKLKIELPELGDIKITMKIFANLNGDVDLTIKLYNKFFVRIFNKNIKGKTDERINILPKLLHPVGVLKNDYFINGKFLSEYKNLDNLNIDFSKVTSIDEGALRNLERFPENVDLSSLVSLEDSSLSSLTKFPDNVNLSKLAYIKGNSLKSLKEFPQNVNLSNLLYIGDEALKNLEKLPQDVNLSNLKKIGKGSLQKLKKLPDNINFSNLNVIEDNSLESLTSLPENIDFSNIKIIGMSSLKNLTSLPENIDFSSLIRIKYNGLGKITSLPENINFSNLIYLDSNALASLKTLPENIDFSSLLVMGGNSLASLTELPNNINISNVIFIENNALKNLKTFRPDIELSDLLVINGEDPFRRKAST
ncbi:MAG: hypothetical protein HRT99_01215 [Mycoplasmatales bacterium]|nr:hypothetical protein [Mycoplasmatales bacterium]